MLDDLLRITISPFFVTKKYFLKPKAEILMNARYRTEEFEGE